MRRGGGGEAQKIHSYLQPSLNPSRKPSDSGSTARKNKIVHIHLETQTKRQMVCIIDLASLAC